MKFLFANIIILCLLTQSTTPMLQMVMKIAGEQILLALVKAALSAVSLLELLT